jgi:hypothetical protein
MLPKTEIGNILKIILSEDFHRPSEEESGYKECQAGCDYPVEMRLWPQPGCEAEQHE